MSQPNDGSGRAPVAIVRPTTSVTSGVAVTQKLVSAAVAFGNLLKGTFGPNGLDKMLYKTNGETAVTNDGAKIVTELLVKHPAAKAFVQLAKSQENACGDGVTGCLIFASELMRESGVLLEKGLHPLVLVNGFREAMDKTIQALMNHDGAAGFDIAAQARRVVYFIAAKKQIIRYFLQVKSQSPITKPEIALGGHAHAIIAAGILGQIILRAVHIAGQGIAPIGG